MERLETLLDAFKFVVDPVENIENTELGDQVNVKIHPRPVEKYPKYQT